MICKDIFFDNPQENILFDDVLLHLAENDQGDEVLRFWESPKDTFVVLGRIGNPQEDVKIDEVLKAAIPVVRRSSGGGTVVQGKGCFNYSLILSKERHPVLHDLRKSYQYILSKVVAVLEQLGIEAEFQPISDIALAKEQKKISGNSQKRGKKFVLHHGTILYDFDLSKIETYLKMPKDVPEYRKERSHLDFVMNASLKPSDIKNGLKRIFDCRKQEDSPSPIEQETLKTFLNTKNVFVDLK